MAGVHLIPLYQRCCGKGTDITFTFNTEGILVTGIVWGFTDTKEAVI